MQRVWWHLILTCRGQWLPGDPRGFRSRKHRIHSSGDYKHRPPAGEHEGLQRYSETISRGAVRIGREHLPRLGDAMLGKTVKMESPCLAMAAGATHTHMLVALPDDWEKVKLEAGRLKQAGSHVLRDAYPGNLWAGGGKPVRIEDRGHQKAVFKYILRHAQEGAWVWRFDGTEGDPGLREAQARLLEEFLKSRK